MLTYGAFVEGGEKNKNFRALAPLFLFRCWAFLSAADDLPPLCTQSWFDGRTNTPLVC